MAIRRIEGMLHLASEGRYAILVGRFNSFVVAFYTAQVIPKQVVIYLA